MKKLLILSTVASLMFAVNSANADDAAKPATKPASAAVTTAVEKAAPVAKEPEKTTPAKPAPAVTTPAKAAPAKTEAKADDKEPVTEISKCDVPKDFIDSLNKIVIDTVESKEFSEAEKTEALSDMFRNYVNIQWIGRFVLAQNWRSLKPAQQTEYLAAYQDYLLRTYVPIFKDYKGEKVQFISATPLKNPAEYMVATKIVRVNEPEIQISYRIKKDASCFKIYDMVAEGVSMLNTQRQDFSSIFARKGYASLISLLKSKVASPTPSK